MRPRAKRTTFSYHFGEISVSGSEKTASQLFDDITKEARRRARNTLGINGRPNQMLDF